MVQNALRLAAERTEQVAKTTQFRRLLTAPELAFIMEAHNGLSAKVVEESGFPGIWASGLSISTALGVRDRNEASWTQVLEVLEFMADCTTVPILLDGDTGYGDFNNFRRLVKKLCQRDVAAVCIEDKVFPKTNSFIGEHQPLADVGEFCGKIKAGKDSQTDDAFSIIARVEALIAGWGLDEALRRAEAYHEAGADGILIHSKRSAPDEILTFAREWGDRGPLVIVPTMYYATPTDRFREAKISLVIWANHNLRAAMTAMRDVSRRIFEEESLVNIEGEVSSVKEIFAITGENELSEAESRYLQPTKGEVRAVVLAASRGSALERLTVDRPKCMLDVRGQPLLRRLTRSLNDCGLRDVTVVSGYKHEAIDVANIRKVVNEGYAEGGELTSLAAAEDALDGECVISYGDILFREYILELLLESEADVSVVIDAGWRELRAQSPKHRPDLAKCSRPHTGGYLEDDPVLLEGIGAAVETGEADGEWVGLVKLSARGAELVRTELAAMAADGGLGKAGLPDLLNRLIGKGVKPQVVYVTGHWMDVNDVFDLASARNFT